MSRPTLALLRSAALLTLGALAVHQLRYLIAFGPASGEALHREGHGYLAEAVPVIVALAAAMLAAGLLAGALPGYRPGRTLRSAGHRALGYAAALLAAYAAQELAEGALLASGGWIAVPLALAFGVIAAVAERLHQRGVERIAASLAPRSRPAPAADPAPLPLWTAGTPLAATPLAFGLARRPPPAPARP